MPAGTGRSRRTGLTDKYEQLVTNSSIPFAMSRLWLLGRPDKEGNDSRSGELLQLWGLDLERRPKNGQDVTYHRSIIAFRNSVGQFYHQYLDELYFRRFIDITGRLWLPTATTDGHYINQHAGNLREFVPDTCEDSLKLSDWDAALRCR